MSNMGQYKNILLRNTMIYVRNIRIAIWHYVRNFLNWVPETVLTRIYIKTQTEILGNGSFWNLMR